ncbi:MAG: potassium channel family protein [Thermomicrobiales bacterium]|nr:potassium channel family protein [Thermomicrobiales bacterium]
MADVNPLGNQQGGPPHIGILRLPEDRPGRALLRRAGLAIAIIVVVAIVLWIDRDGLRDNAHPDREMRFLDVFYFTVVSLTTVGYGDIVPVSDGGRLINAVFLTPIRIFLWALFLGTAYEVTLLRLRLREERRMRELHDRLRDHVVVCGYGVKGRAIVSELTAHEEKAANIVVIDESEEAVTAAAKQGLVALRGDAASEALLKAASVQRAAWVLVAPNRDDAAVLICLTVRNLAPDVQIIASAREEENIKLLYRAGADLVVAPAVAGGRLMGSAVRQRVVPFFLEDILAFGKGLSLSEHTVTAQEAGRTASAVVTGKDHLVIGIARGHQRLQFNEIAGETLKEGDVIVYLNAHDQPPDNQNPLAGSAPGESRPSSAPAG